MSELERSLVALGRELAVPRAPDLAPQVLAEIRPQRAEAPASRGRFVPALAVVLAAALLAALAIPDARSALARVFGIGAAQIELVDELPEVAPAEAELELTLGQRVTLEQARERAGFDLLELDEEPDSVYVGDRGTIWFLYGRPDGVRLLVAQMPELGLGGPALVKKLADAGTRVEEVEVRGEQGFFLSGDPHLLFLVGEDGEVVGDSARLARQVLLWAEDGRTIRLEGDLDEEEAQRLAEALGVRSRG